MVTFQTQKSGMIKSVEPEKNIKLFNQVKKKNH